MQISGRSIFITGAASGLGRATATALHDVGANVILADLNVDKAEKLASELGARAVAAAVDVRDPQQIENALDLACEVFGSVHVAVSCAGIPSSAKLYSRGEAHSLDTWSQTLDINLTGTFNVMRLCAARMMNNGLADDGDRGVIINTASIAAFDGQKGQVAYAASKAGVAGMTLPAARDLADKAIRCIAIAPGLFETELFDAIPSKGIEALKQGLLYPNRMGHPREFASLVRQIIENTYLNGSCLRLDGGARLP